MVDHYLRGRGGIKPEHFLGKANLRIIIKIQSARYIKSRLLQFKCSNIQGPEWFNGILPIKHR